MVIPKILSDDGASDGSTVSCVSPSPFHAVERCPFLKKINNKNTPTMVIFQYNIFSKNIPVQNMQIVRIFQYKKILY
jgi:hypothetical protein